MKKIRVATLAALLVTTTALSAESGSYLCITDKATGFSFDKERKSWEEASFNIEPMRYILKPSPTKEHPNGWEVAQFGEDFPLASCPDGFNTAQVIRCENMVLFIFDSQTGRFIYVYYIGYTRPFGKEGSDTPTLAIGKCSKI